MQYKQTLNLKLLIFLSLLFLQMPISVYSNKVSGKPSTESRKPPHRPGLEAIAEHKAVFPGPLITEKQHKFLQAQKAAQEKKDQEKAAELAWLQAQAEERARLQKKINKVSESLTPIVQAESLKIPELLNNTQQIQSILSPDTAHYTLLQDREQAIIDFQKDPNKWNEQSYTIKEDCLELLAISGVKKTEYSNFIGNKIQHAVHQEIITIISDASQLQTKGTPATLKVNTFVVNASEAARLLNKSGKWAQAFQVNNFTLTALNPNLQHQATGQLAATMFALQKEDTTIKAQWYQALEDLTPPKDYAEGIITAAKTYAALFQKTDTEFHLEVIHVLADTCSDKLGIISSEKLYKLLDEHHESICLEAVRHLSAQGVDQKTLNNTVKEIINAPGGYTKEQEGILSHFLDEVNPPKRIQSFSDAKYCRLMPFLYTPEGILKEYSFACATNQIPVTLCTQNNTANRTYQLLDQYQNASNEQQKEVAKLGLSFLKQSVETENKFIAQAYKNLEKNRHEVQKSRWSAYVTPHYDDPIQQNVQNECTWLAEKTIQARKKINSKDNVSNQLLDYVDNQLEYTFEENLKNNPADAQELFTDLLKTIFGCQSIEQISKKHKSDLSHAIKQLTKQYEESIHVIASFAEPRVDFFNEQVDALTNEYGKWYIQSGNVVRNYSQLPKEEQEAMKKPRTPSKSSRIRNCKSLLIHWAIGHMKDIYPGAYEQFKNILPPHEFHQKVHEWAVKYAEKIEESEQPWQAMPYDLRPRQLNAKTVALPLADIFGFNIEPTLQKDEKDCFTLTHLDPIALRNFKESYPDPVAMEKELDDWCDEVDLWPESTQAEACARYEARETAYAKAPYVLAKHTYQLSSETQNLLQKFTINKDIFTEGIYNLLQHQLHTELVDIIAQICEAYTTECTSAPRFIANMATIGAQFNKIGDVIIAANMADLCWSMVDCSLAALEGIALGVVDVADYALNHKTEMVLLGLCPALMSKYYLAKLALNVTLLTVDYGYAAYNNFYEDGKYYNEKAKEFEEFFKSASLHGAVLGASTFATRMYLQGKLDKQVAKYVGAGKDIAKDILPSLSLEDIKLNRMRRAAERRARKTLGRHKKAENCVLQEQEKTWEEYFSSLSESERLEELKFRREPKNIYKTVEDTGERCRTGRPTKTFNSNYTDRWAAKQYRKIRHSKNDIEAIAQNTSLPLSKVKRIKEHLFYNKHNIQEYCPYSNSINKKIARFHPDPEIAAAWDRLRKGDYIKNDLALLTHEYAEARFENIFKTDYETSHDRIQMRWFWDHPKFKE